MTHEEADIFIKNRTEYKLSVPDSINNYDIKSKLVVFKRLVEGTAISRDDIVKALVWSTGVPVISSIFLKSLSQKGVYGLAYELSRVLLTTEAYYNKEAYISKRSYVDGDCIYYVLSNNKVLLINSKERLLPEYLVYYEDIVFLITDTLKQYVLYAGKCLGSDSICDAEVSILDSIDYKS